MNTTSVAVNRTSSRPSTLWKTTLILIPFVTLGLLLWLRHIEVNALRQRAVSSYGTVPSFQLVNQNGQPFGSAQLTGKIWIADFIYTTCPGPCPMISSRMSELQKPLEKTDVHLVSFSVDPEKDTPKVLRPVHSTRMVLVDRHGDIRGYYDATEADAITKLVADTSHLLREQPK